MSVNEAIQQKAPLRDGRNVRASLLFQVDGMFEIRGYILFKQCDIRGGSSLKVDQGWKNMSWGSR